MLSISAAFYVWTKIADVLLSRNSPLSLPYFGKKLNCFNCFYRINDAKLIIHWAGHELGCWSLKSRCNGIFNDFSTFWSSQKPLLYSSLALDDFGTFHWLVSQSDGVEQTNYLAQRYCQEAIRQISRLRASPERDALIRLTELVLSRDKWSPPVAPTNISKRRAALQAAMPLVNH